jgi:hypothetical protein
VLQHHDTAEQERSGVSKALAGNVRSRTVHSFEDRALVTNVSGRRKTETANETGAHIRENITVQVGHDKDLVIVWRGVSDHLQAGVVEELGIKLDIRELLGNFSGSVEEKTVGHLHNSSLVHNTDLVLARSLSMLESETENAFGCLACNKLDALDNAINNNVLDTRVFTLSVLTNQDSVDVVVWGLVSGNGAARTKVSEEVEGTAKSKVERNVSLANGSL